MSKNENFDRQTIESFGDEWSSHPQQNINTAEMQRMFDDYFHIVPWETIPEDACAFDMGAGTGRWARFVTPKVGELHVIDASQQALDVARKNLETMSNIYFHTATTDNVSLQPESFDFGYSLGVLHHIPNTAAALDNCVKLLRPGGLILLYLYYNFDNRPAWFQRLWQVSDKLRQGISCLPPQIKGTVTNLLALLIYWPLSRLAWLLELLGINPDNLPLSSYRHSSIATLRTDSRDRFGTPLEQRFSRSEITEMMRSAGLENIQFSDKTPYWTAIGIKTKKPTN